MLVHAGAAGVDALAGAAAQRISSLSALATATSDTSNTPLLEPCVILRMDCDNDGFVVWTFDAAWKRLELKMPVRDLAEQALKPLADAILAEQLALKRGGHSS